MKLFKYLLISLIIIILSSACANQERVVSVVDEDIYEENRLRFQELDEYFKETYTVEDRTNRSKDENFDEYVTLWNIYATGQSKNNADYATIQATVNLNNQSIQLRNNTIHYEQSNSGPQFDDTQTDFSDATLTALVNQAKSEYQEDRNYNFSLLIRTLWMPILFLAIGILSIIRPRWIWWIEGGHKYKDSEPSDFSLGVNTFRGFLAIGLAIIFAIFIFNRLR